VITDVADFPWSYIKESQLTTPDEPSPARHLGEPGVVQAVVSVKS